MAKRDDGSGGKGGVVVSLFGGPRDVVKLFARAMTLDQKRETWGHAERLYREVVRLAPGHWEAWNNLGVMAYQLGRKADALHAWGKALEADDLGAETHNNIGSLFQDEGKLEVAAVYLARAVRLDPDMSEARVNLAMVLQGLGRPKAALRHWRYYLRRWPQGDNAELARKHEALCEAAAR